MPTLTRLAGSLILLFIVSCAIVQFAQPDFSPLHIALSYYLNGRMGWLLTIGLISLGAGSLMLVIKSRNHLASRAGLILLSLWSLGAIIGGIFPPDPYGRWDQPPSTSAIIHNIAAMIAFVAFPVAALLLSTHNAALRVLAWSSALSIVVFFATLMPVFQNRPPYGLGLAERVALGLFVCWLIALAKDPSTNLKSSRARMIS